MPSPESLAAFYFARPSIEGSTGVLSQKADILARLEAAVGEIQDSATFHRYSFSNTLLILAARPDATIVAGYNTWLKLHRYVRKGEQGIRIFVPMRTKPRDDDLEDKQRLFFGIGTVFALEQTEGEPLPAVDVPVLESDDGGSLYRELEALARREGLALMWSQDNRRDGPMGAYLPQEQRIELREASPLQMAKTLAHELAHHFGEHQAVTAEHETIAEAVAYVVCSHFGLDTGARSFPYVAVWSREPAVLKGVLSTVQKVSATIINAVEGTAKPAGAEPHQP
jgi:antirestriction protein ArdC